MAWAESTSTSLPKADPLESLRSPELPDFESKDRERESVITDSELQDIILDDETVLDDVVFSPVSLTRGPSPEPDASSNDMDVLTATRPRSISPPPIPAFNPNPTGSGHKKSASMTTIRSGNNMPFIVARLNLKDERRSSYRGSVDGQQKLQEEFARLHKEEEDIKNNATCGAIDWGRFEFLKARPDTDGWLEYSDFWGAVISGTQRLSIESKEGEEEADENVKYDVDQFVQDAVALHITPFMLDAYRHEYEDQLRETNKHAIEMDELRSTNRALSLQVKNLENSLAQLNVEHVDLLNELVKSRLKNEEMEEELVRYKLLQVTIPWLLNLFVLPYTSYAEAMHENQDAQSSHRISIAHMLKLKRGSNY
ncbi:hypothetical protein H0H81_000733 [Sphagnurus paluster]|uniref:Rab-GAP TBC domain-containing protein n=1 Tax=Sphagnurus paluster TaxID=117069 RepID=A0A9P7FW30_9AGAR|nr:hypothetical protein H0H81_000733 [Sphagnurus paluster]